MHPTAIVEPSTPQGTLASTFQTVRSRRRRWLTAPALLLASIPIAGCVGSGDDDDPDGSAGVTQVAPEGTTPGGSGLLYCDALPDQTDSLDFAGVQFSPVPNGLVTGQALAYALQWPYYVTVWPRATDSSWIIVGVSGGMFELQTELDANWPGARVLAMNITWNEQQLASLADQVRAAVPDATVEWSIATGRVSVSPSNADDDFFDALAAFAGSPVCVDAPAAGG